MPRIHQPVEFNTFVAGLITEASPLTFPQNASLDEENFVLLPYGSRTRRNGMDYEDGFVVVDSGQSMPSDNNPIISIFKWNNVGGNSTKTFIVVQIGNRIHFFDASVQPLSNGLVGYWDYDNSVPIIRFSFASVDGKLVVVTGRQTVDVFSYTDDTSFTVLSKSLLVRDLFGVTDIAGG